MSNAENLKKSVELLRTPLEDNDPAMIHLRFLSLGDIMMSGFRDIKSEFDKIDGRLKKLEVNTNEIKTDMKDLKESISELPTLEDIIALFNSNRPTPE